MKINGSSIPDANNRGRMFPLSDTGPHFAGPCIVGDVLMVVKAWQNKTHDGKIYYRLVFENPDQCPNLIGE